MAVSDTAGAVASTMLVVGLCIVVVALIVGCASKKKGGKGQYKCEWCGEAFDVAEALQRHTESEHTVGGRSSTKTYIEMKESNLVVNRVNPFDDADTPTRLAPASPPPLPPPDEVAPPEVVPFHMTQDSPQSGANDIIQMIPTYEEPQGADYPERKLMQRDGILGQLTMSRGDFNLGEKLGSGAGGIVYRGMLGSTPIAVKELIEESSEAREEFLQEAVIMGSLKHSRIVQILGVCIEDHLPMQIIVELMENGDMRTYLRKKRRDGLNVLKVGYPMVLQVCQDACQGLVFLESIGCVHRDVAARNVLLDGDLRGKLTDFGLSRDLYRKVYYEMQSARQLPVRWLAIETLTMGKASSKSDVWSFGVMMWETITLCKLPYETMPGGREIVTYLDSGKRLPQPKRCPDAIFTLLLACWTAAPADRPSFKELLPRLDGLAASARAGTLLQTVENSSNGALPPTPGQREHPLATPLPSPPTTRKTTVRSHDHDSSDARPAVLPRQESISDFPQALPPPKRPWWSLGPISRSQAEETMRAWGPQKGLFLVRESGDNVWVLSRCIANGGGEVPLKFSHSKIVAEGDQYRLITKNASIETTTFASLETLVQNFQFVAFPDSSKLIITPPPLAIVDYIEIVDDRMVAPEQPGYMNDSMVGNVSRYINVKNPGGVSTPGTPGAYTNISIEADVFRSGSGIGTDEDADGKLGRYINARSHAPMST